MTDEGNGRENGAPDTSNNSQHRESHLEAGLSVLSGLLGNLIEIHIRRGPLPSQEQVDRGAIGGTERSRRRYGHHSTPDQVAGGRKQKSEQCLIDTRFIDDEFVIIADIPTTNPDDLTVGYNRRTNELVISRDGTVIGRVDIPWKSPETPEVWFNNGVLEARIRQTDV